MGGGDVDLDLRKLMAPVYIVRTQLCAQQRIEGTVDVVDDCNLCLLHLSLYFKARNDEAQKVR